MLHTGTEPRAVPEHAASLTERVHDNVHCPDLVRVGVVECRPCGVSRDLDRVVLGLVDYEDLVGHADKKLLGTHTRVANNLKVDGTSNKSRGVV